MVTIVDCYHFVSDNVRDNTWVDCCIYSPLFLLQLQLFFVDVAKAKSKAHSIVYGVDNATMHQYWSPYIDEYIIHNGKI